MLNHQVQIKCLEITVFGKLEIASISLLPELRQGLFSLFSLFTLKMHFTACGVSVNLPEPLRFHSCDLLLNDLLRILQNMTFSCQTFKDL